MTGTSTDPYLTAYHEAGHAVAALVCGLRLTSITIEPDPGNPEIRGNTGVSFDKNKPTHYHFSVFAGPWAEARVQWPHHSLGSLDDGHGGGRSFRSYVFEALEGVDRDGDSVKYVDMQSGKLPDGSSFNHPDREIAQREGRPTIEVVADRERRWSRHLEKRCWPIIIPTVAGMLLGGSTDVDAITATVRWLWGTAGNTALLDPDV
jgi:hypothetical protein